MFVFVNGRRFFDGAAVPAYGLAEASSGIFNA
jgi:hypothetical protein